MHDLSRVLNKVLKRSLKPVEYQITRASRASTIGSSLYNLGFLVVLLQENYLIS